ncbi:SDR family NAD(P)-dependent oxidoreductase [bacterium]|nr:SDR family NAD(P)-dependent oxidoreductase [bacterium]
MQIEDFFTSKVVVITGASGFIGSHLSERLLAAGNRVIGVDNFITGNRKNTEHLAQNPHWELFEQDICDTQGLNALLDKILSKYDRIDMVLHFASPASPPGYQRHPRETYLVNSLATDSLLAWLRGHSPESRFLFAGTSEAYGNPQVHPQPETYWGNVNPNGPRSCYDEAKRLGETICGVYDRDFGLDTRIVRIFNTYGPRMDLADGRILPQFIQEIRRGQPLTVYGDGSQTRSYCFIDDLVEAVLRLAASPDGAGQTVNCGNPGEYTVLQTAQICNQVAGRAAEMIEFRPLPTDDPLRRRPDITKARQLLSWEPKVAFADGLRVMMTHYGIDVKN